MKNSNFTILIPAILEEFFYLGKPSIEINETNNIILHIEGDYDRFSVKIFPGSSTYVNTEFFKRCFSDSENRLETFIHTLINLFDTHCYEVSDNSNIIAI